MVTGLSGEHELSFYWSEIVWAAITIGKRNWADVCKHGRYLVIAAIFKVSMIFAYFKEDSKTNNIIKSEVYKNSYPSEKGEISYFQGIILTKILANRLFDVPWLMHLDIYKSRIAYCIIKDSRPDLIELDMKNDWFVFEVKGRSNGFKRDVQHKAKDQAKQLITI